jgi:hypothetical protein
MPGGAARPTGMWPKGDNRPVLSQWCFLKMISILLFHGDSLRWAECSLTTFYCPLFSRACASWRSATNHTGQGRRRARQSFEARFRTRRSASLPTLDTKWFLDRCWSVPIVVTDHRF